MPSNDAPTPAQDLLNRKYLFGDRSGERARLENKGVKLDLYYTDDALANPTGGPEDAALWGRIRGTVDVDFSKFTEWEGLTFHITGVWQYGTNLSKQYTGTLVDSTSLPSAHTLRLDSYWLQQYALHRKLVVRIGQIAAYDTYGNSEYGASYINLVMGYAHSNLNQAVIFAFNPAGVPSFEIKARPTEHVYVQAMVQSEERNPYSIDSNGLDFHLGGSVLATEIGYSRNPPKNVETTNQVAEPSLTDRQRGLYQATYKFGAGYNPHKFLDPLTHVSSPGNHLLYGQVAQVVYRRSGVGPDQDRGLDLIYGEDWSPGDVTQDNHQIMASGRYAGLLGSRHSKDTFSVGYVWTSVGSHFRESTAPGGGAKLTHEHLVEVSYLAANLNPLVAHPARHRVVRSTRRRCEPGHGLCSRLSDEGNLLAILKGRRAALQRVLTAVSETEEIMAQYVLSLDQGTTSSRAMLFDHDGKIAGLAQHEFKQHYPDTGWVEHDPMDILTSQLSSAVEVLAKARVRPRDVVALGIANQRETTIVWDRETGVPIYNAIVWQDRRTAAFCDQLRADGNEEQIRNKTGLLIDSYFSGTKIAWMLENVDGARKRAEDGKLAFGTVDSWLIWHLTSGKKHITDRTNASRTLLYNIVEDKWDTDLLKMLQVPESMMPEVVWSSGCASRVTTSLGFGDVEIAGIAGDQQAALFGQLCVSPGDAKNTYGTGCFLLQHIGEQFTLSKERMLTTLACSTDRKLQYALEGSIFMGGAIVQWLRDKMEFFERAPDIEKLAASVGSSNNVVLVPAFTGLGAPHWDPYASGMIIGLQRSTGTAEIARAASESIAFQVTDVLRAMEQDTQYGFKKLKADGGAADNNMLMQFQADMLGIPVERPAVLETTAQGAAYLAGLAVGFWADIDKIAGTRPEGQTFHPQMDREQARKKYTKWQDAVNRSKGWNKEVA